MRRLRFVLVSAWAVGVVVACASSAPESVEPTEQAPTTKKDAGAKDSSVADSAVEEPDTGGGPEPDAAMTLPETYQGKLASSAKTSFGGSPYCTYEVTLTKIEVQVILTGPGGDVKSMTVKCRMVEGTVQPCSQPPIAANDHTYTLTAAKETTGGFHVDLAAAATNMPKASLAVELKRNATGFDAALEWHRIDLGAPFDWRVKAAIPVTLVP